MVFKTNEIGQIGFENLSHFGYAFRKRFGYAPNRNNRLKFQLLLIAGVISLLIIYRCLIFF